MVILLKIIDNIVTKKIDKKTIYFDICYYE